MTIIRSPHSRWASSPPIASTWRTSRRLARSINSSSSSSDSAAARSRSADHLLGPQAHLVEALQHLRVALVTLGELHELRDGHAEISHALEMEVDMEDREYEPQVDGDWGLAREQ